MKSKSIRRTAIGAAGIMTLLALAGVLGISSHAKADDDSAFGSGEAALIKRGFEIAPVPLNLYKKNLALVGLGSYIVNAAADCNGCHTGGGPPNFNYADKGNPYFGQPQKGRSNRLSERGFGFRAGGNSDWT